jgi:hypothetical protein
MDRDIRGFLISVCVLFGGLFVTVGLEQFQKNTCRIEAIKASMPADDIAKVCK